MEMNALLKGIKNCSCGMDHNCDIDFVSIRSGAVMDIQPICEKYDNILLVADNNTYATCGDKVSSLIGSKIQNKLVFETIGFLVPNEETIGRINELVFADTELIIGIGSGVINDLCKYVSFQHKLPYYIIATAPSMDGYASKGAPMILRNMKESITTHVPKAIIGDTDILKNAPMDMIRAGFGDIIGKYSALNDWKLSHYLFGEHLCEYVYDMTYDVVKKTESLADGIQKRDPEAIKTLMEALVFVGIAMSYVGYSRPASGSEHHFSHFFEITGILNNAKYFHHGIDVVYSTVMTSYMRNRLLSMNEFPENYKEFDRKEWVNEIERVYGKASEGVIKLQDKCGYYEKEKEYVKLYKEKWQGIKQILSEVPKADDIIGILDAVGLDYSEFEKCYGKEHIDDCIHYSKDFKDRYTFLWIYDLVF